MKAVLLPSFKEPYKEIFELTQLAITADNNVIISENIHEILAKIDKITNIVIIMGAGDPEKNKIISPPEAMELLKDANPKIKIRIIDAIIWNIPHQLILPTKSFVKLVRKALEARQKVPTKQKSSGATRK